MVNTKFKIGSVVLIALISIALFWLLSNREDMFIAEKEIVFSTGCTDFVDWSNLPQDKKIEECNKILNRRTSDLKNIGFESRDCKIIKVEIKSCTQMLGTQLVCTYICKKQ